MKWIFTLTLLFSLNVHADPLQKLLKRDSYCSPLQKILKKCPGQKKTVKKVEEEIQEKDLEIKESKKPSKKSKKVVEEEFLR